MMSTPQVHTFGIAKYVYAAAYDELEAECVNLKDALADALSTYIAFPPTEETP
jgi:hypothetical protein